MKTSTALCPPLAAALLALPGLGQGSSLELPAPVALAECSQGSYWPFGYSGLRSQVLIDGAAVAVNGAVVFELRFRADRGMAPLAAHTWSNVTVRMSHSAVPYHLMSRTFAANETETPVVVYQGPLTLPAQTPGLAGPQPWNVVVPLVNPFTYDRNLGNLLIDIVNELEIDPPQAYLLDAAEPGGGATTFGHGGDHPGFDTLSLRATSLPVHDPLRYSPGNTIEFTTTRQFSQAPGLLLLSTTAKPVPQDLGPLGAPGNELYVELEALVNLPAWTFDAAGYHATLGLAVPNVPSLAGVVIYGQSVVLDPTANAMGALTSEAVEVRLGDANDFLPMRQLDGLSTGATGFLLDFGDLSPRFGALALRLEGAFF